MNPLQYSPFEANLMDRLRHQMEYYFSPANLSKDTFLVDLLKKHDGSVPIEVIARFPKIRALFSIVRNGIGNEKVNTVSESTELTWLVRAVRASVMITLSNDATLIRPSFVANHPNTPPPPPPRHLGVDDSMASPAWSVSSDGGVPVQLVTFYPPHFQWQPPLPHYYYHPGMISFHTTPACHDEYKGLKKPQPLRAKFDVNPKPIANADAKASQNQLEWTLETSKDRRGKKRPTRRGGGSHSNQMKADSSTHSMSSKSYSIGSSISLSPTPTSDVSKTKQEDVASLPSLSSSPSLTTSNRRRSSHRRARRNKTDSDVNVLGSDFPALDGISTVLCPVRSCSNWAMVVKSSGDMHRKYVNHEAMNRLSLMSGLMPAGA